MSFRTKNQSAKWTPEETRKFYKAIEIFGADFSLIAKLFPSRNRDQIKNKFNREEKINVKMIDEAFKKNTILCKRSLMDRIRTFNNSVKSGELMALANNELPEEIGGFDKLERRLSNTSTDSMDIRIMEEIQDIFIKEIKPANNFLPSISLNNVNERAFGHFDLDLNLTNEFPNEINARVGEAEVRQGKPINEEDPKKKNLLLRLMY